MKDSLGRTIDYMRISITDRCNLRCRYCMPYGIQTSRCQDILRFEEIQEVAACAASLGIRNLKLTGGEPLVRKDCCHLVEMLKAVPGIEKVTMTTNGVLLEQYLEDLVKAGIDGINISLDTLDEKIYADLTGSDSCGQVVEALKHAAQVVPSVKVNAVSLDLGRENWIRLVELAEKLPVDIRFIEMMPVGYGKEFASVDHRDLLEEMKGRYKGMEEDRTRHGPGPAVYYQIPGFSGSIGFISAIHGKFCSSCNRVRLTAKGYLKTCLCYEDGADLRSVLRAEPVTAGERQERLREAFREAVWKKPAAHCFEEPEHMTETESMVSIGG